MATPPLTMRARRRAESGSPPTAGRAGSRSSTSRPRRPSAPWPWRRPTRRSCGPAPAKPGPSAIATCRATASTSPPTPAPPGRTWGWSKAAASAVSSCIPPIANIVYACVAGRLTGPQEERGVFRTKDGGTTWKRILFVDPNTGCSGLSLDPKDPNFMVAGTWDVVMHTYAMFSGGPGSGVYTSHDGGDTWKQRRGARHAEIARRQDRCGDRAQQSQARLRADSDGRPGLGLALGRRRRELGGGELAARVDRARRLLHPARRQSRERR